MTLILFEAYDLGSMTLCNSVDTCP